VKKLAIVGIMLVLVVAILAPTAALAAPDSSPKERAELGMYNGVGIITSAAIEGKSAFAVGEIAVGGTTTPSLWAGEYAVIRPELAGGVLLGHKAVAVCEDIALLSGKAIGMPMADCAVTLVEIIPLIGTIDLALVTKGGGWIAYHAIGSVCVFLS
jgi:hypothetical protein